MKRKAKPSELVRKFLDEHDTLVNEKDGRVYLITPEERYSLLVELEARERGARRRSRG